MVAREGGSSYPLTTWRQRWTPVPDVPARSGPARGTGSMSSRSSPTRLNFVPITQPFEGRSDTCDFTGCQRWPMAQGVRAQVSLDGRRYIAAAFVASADGRYFMEAVSNEPYEIARVEMAEAHLLSILLKDGYRPEQLTDRLRGLLDEWSTGQRPSIARPTGPEGPPIVETQTGARDARPSDNEDRDCWLYDEYVKGTHLNVIRSNLVTQHSAWEAITSKPGISQAVSRAALRWRIPKPRHGQRRNDRPCDC
jgi:hypothetical protein